ncbi:hypothetical protein EMCG_01551 [[Emmonsia] crescens]|uniref:Uncharacterized protein n=1 Tax=[Emmonsia] crescens TaxID=73230 RepID=A0A0G2I1U8_9EURO|nr:hypothetical protein EMCG_01551 [Emmonsia crescens UAMH 3008]
MNISPASMTILNVEFERLRRIRMIRLMADVMAFLDEIQSSLPSKGISNPRCPFGRSLIHYAAIGDCTELLVHLIEYRTEIDYLDRNKRTPLSWAAEYGSLNAVRILLKHGAKVNTIDDIYCTPLTWLVKAGDVESGSLAATEAYLRKKGARRRGLIRAWFLNKLGLL